MPQFVGTCNMTISQSVQLAQRPVSAGEPVLTVTTAPGNLMYVDMGGHTMSTDTFPAIVVQNGDGSVEIRNGNVVGGAVDSGNGSSADTMYDHVTFDGRACSLSETTPAFPTTGSRWSDRRRQLDQLESGSRPLRRDR